VSSALWIIVTNLFAATFGPLMVGVLNDRVFHGPNVHPTQR
jgi:hypothetical protein